MAGVSYGAYGMSAFDVNRRGIASLSQFIARIEKGRETGESPNKIIYTGKYGIIYSGQQVVHATTKHREHMLTAEQMDDTEGSTENPCYAVWMEIWALTM